jgi:dihydrofolate reductase
LDSRLVISQIRAGCRPRQHWKGGRTPTNRKTKAEAQMSEPSDEPAGRTVVANISLSPGGRVNGPGGDYDMSWIVPHALTDGAREHMVKVTNPASTALLGRKNYQGFASYWPAVAGNPDAGPPGPRLRPMAQRGRQGRLLRHPARGRLAQLAHRRRRPGRGGAPPAQAGGGDIIVLASASIIRNLLAAGEVDRLSITLCPALAGGGARLFGDDLPGSAWSLAETTPTGSGAICLLYDRQRPA